jgi:dihydrofolate synthase/folylpolyglutamate synthase
VSEAPPVLVDGAHNPDAAAALARSLAELYPGRPLGLLLGMCGDKDAAGILRPFRGIARRLWIVPIDSERSMPAAEIVNAAAALGLAGRAAALPEARREAEEWAGAAGGVVCIAGSLFLAGQVLTQD